MSNLDAYMIMQFNNIMLMSQMIKYTINEQYKKKNIYRLDIFDSTILYKSTLSTVLYIKITETM